MGSGECLTDVQLCIHLVGVHDLYMWSFVVRI